MTITKRLLRLATVSVALSGLLSGALAAAPASAAAASCVLGAPTVINATKPLGIKYSVKRTVTVKVTNCTPKAASATAVSWWFSMVEGGPTKIVTLRPTYVATNTYSFSGSYTDYPADMVNFFAGSYPTFVQTVRAGTTAKRAASTIKLLRASRGDLDVWWRGSVKPPKGYWLYVNAYLERANWDTGKYGVYNNKAVTMQFKPNGGAYKTITVNESKDATGRTGGVFWVKATVDGCYRFVWKGNSITGPSTSKSNCVDVK